MPGDCLFENRCARGGLRFRGGGRGRGPQLGGAALRGEVLSPPTRLDYNAELFHGLTPTAKCGRRIRGLLEAPGWRCGDHTPSNCRPCVVSCFQGQRSWVGWCCGEWCCRRLRGSTLTLKFSMGLRPRLSADAASRLTGSPGLAPRGLFSDTAAFAARLELPGWRFGEWCWRRIRGSAGTPGLMPGGCLFENRCPTMLRGFGVLPRPTAWPGPRGRGAWRGGWGVWGCRPSHGCSA